MVQIKSGDGWLAKAWVAWFNEHRLLASIGYIPPAEAEANYYRNIAEQAALAA
jgi:transposase InsO family protein